MLMDEKDRELLVEVKVSLGFLAENMSRFDNALETRLTKLETDVNKRLDNQDGQLRTLSKVVWGLPAALIIGIIGLWMSGGMSIG